MDNKRLEQLIWVLIYGGLLVLALGLFMPRGEAGFGGLLIAAGAVAALLGAVLIVVRARRPDEPRR